MPASLAPITPELLADFKGGKESALEQIFRANFEALTKDANEILQDVAAAQKVAASAILDVWDRRAKVDSATQLEALVHQALNGEAHHEQRRRAAAHHMGGNGKAHDAAPAAPETTDQWWVKVQGVLHNVDDRAEVARQRAEHSRHEAAQHMKKVAQPNRTGLYVVIILLVVVAAGVPLWYFNKGAESTKAGQLLGRDDAKVLHTKDGQRGPLPAFEEGTVVNMGSATTLKYTKSFPLDAHALQVVGTAVIKTPKSSSPLLVKLGNAWVYASDAEFIVRSFPEDSNAATLKTLAGSVTVKAGKEQRTLNAGASAYVLSNGVFMDLQADRASLAFDWADGKFVSDNQPLRKVLAEFKRWYDLSIVPKDTSFLDRPVSMTATIDTTKQSRPNAIAALEEGASVKITLVSDARASLVDNASAPKPKAKAKRK